MEQKWTVAESAELYGIDRWGAPYFQINDAGHISCRPHRNKEIAIDLKGLVDDLHRRGIQAPLLLRFNDLLEARISNLHSCFKNSISAYGYNASYRGVMPIKVNQQRHVVEELVKHGAAHHLGLEAGSKPELLAAMALLEGPDGLIICNGYKDAEYVDLALEAQNIGLRPYVVLDRFAELELVIERSRKLGIKPLLGVRVKLAARGSGRWKESSGNRSKFGLSARELVLALQRLKEEKLIDSLRLLHFHIGSQITAIKSVKDAVREAAQLYVHLRKMGATQLDIVDCGGGLAIDYDGSCTNFHSSKNYSDQEYANDVVSVLQHYCDLAAVPHPNIVTEAGRALVAHHSVLVFNVLGSHSVADQTGVEKIGPPGAGAHEILHRMWEAFSGVTTKNYQESYNDIMELKDESVSLFAHGVIDLKTRAYSEEIFWGTCQKIALLIKKLDYVPEDLKRLEKDLSHTYYCNFSIFQSLPDAWAVGHLFPIAPLQSLQDEPKISAVLADLTCDSDGKIDKFVHLRDVQDTIKLHALTAQPYYLGVFLVGAYQETLGDLHNLFGDTNVVHVSVDPRTGYKIDHVLQGDTVSEVLGYVEYDRADLVQRIHRKAEIAVRSGGFTPEQFAKFIKLYEEGLSGYTYLEDTCE